MKKLKVAVVIMAMCSFVMAQTKTAEKKSSVQSAHENAAAAGAAMAKPAPEITKVLRTVGTWSTTVKNEPSPWDPKGSTAKGTMVMSKGPGGLSVIQDLHTKSAMGPYQGHAIIYWDTIANKQSSVWCDNISGCVFGVTKMDGDNKWSTEMEQEFQGKKMKMVSHGTLVDQNTMHEEFTQSIDGGPMIKIMTLDSKRAGKTAAVNSTKE
jgi:hypothetical protein